MCEKLVLQRLLVSLMGEMQSFLGGEISLKEVESMQKLEDLISPQAFISSNICPGN